MIVDAVKDNVDIDNQELFDFLRSPQIVATHVDISQLLTDYFPGSTIQKMYDSWKMARRPIPPAPAAVAAVPPEPKMPAPPNAVVPKSKAADVPPQVEKLSPQGHLKELGRLHESVPLEGLLSSISDEELQIVENLAQQVALDRIAQYWNEHPDAGSGFYQINLGEFQEGTTVYTKTREELLEVRDSLGDMFPVLLESPMSEEDKKVFVLQRKGDDINSVSFNYITVEVKEDNSAKLYEFG